MRVPELYSQLQLGDESVYIVEIDDSGTRSFGVTSGFDTTDNRVVLTAHDNMGNEVEIRFYPEDDND